MKTTTTFFAILLATVIGALGLPISSFVSWDDLIEQSPDIIIARCTAAQDLLEPKPISFYGNIFSSDIAVLSVLKGCTKPGSSHMVSLCLPFRGEYFLAFGSYFTNKTGTAYKVVEDYRVVPLMHFHGTNSLAGLDLKTQIRLLMKSRLDDLNDELARDYREKQRIEAAFQTNSSTGIFSNKPPIVPETRSPKGTGTF